MAPPPMHFSGRRQRCNGGADKNNEVTFRGVLICVGALI